jgi:phage tail-like protein
MAAALSRDPYKNFRFKVFFGNNTTPVAGINRVTGLNWSVAVETREQGGSYRSSAKLPGRVTYDNVTLERGITTDQGFQDWAGAVWNYTNSNPLKSVQQSLVIALCDENGSPAIRYQLVNCWVSRFNALPELSSLRNELALEQITIEHDGWSQSVIASSRGGS